MKWVKFRIKTITEAEDVIISTLYDIGLEGAQIEDKIPLTSLEKEQMFVDILPEGPEDDGIAYLSFFVEKKEDGGLEVKECLQTTLRNLRLIGGVRGVPRGVLKHIAANNGRNSRRIVTHTDE